MEIEVPLEKELLQEKCGIIALFTPDYQNQLPLALKAGLGVQHRGQNGVGLAMSTENGINHFAGDGLMRDAFTSEVIGQFDVPSLWTMLHSRYATDGGYDEYNLQPCIGCSPELKGQVAVIHNGQFVNIEGMRDKVKGDLPDQASDTYIFTQLLTQSPGNSWEEKIINTLEEVKGAYSLIIGTEEALYVARDDQGIRPLVIGQYNHEGWIVASETHALSKLGIKPLREVRKGEVFKIDKEGLSTLKKGEEGPGHFCDFEWDYFALPVTKFPLAIGDNEGAHPERWKPVGRIRERCGQILAQEHPILNATIVMGMPDSGNMVAAAYASELKLPFRPYIMRDHFDPAGSTRTFQEDKDKKSIRTLVLGKLSLIDDPEVWKDAIVVLGDDSIVRGDVSREITELIFKLGAKEVHWVVGFPPIIDKCHLGVSMRTHEELIAVRNNSDYAKIAKEIGATSVHYISREGFIKARTLSDNLVIPEDRDDIFLANGGCGGCLTGHHPISREGEVYHFKLR